LATSILIVLALPSLRLRGGAAARREAEEDWGRAPGASAFHTALSAATGIRARRQAEDHTIGTEKDWGRVPGASAFHTALSAATGIRARRQAEDHTIGTEKHGVAAREARMALRIQRPRDAAGQRPGAQVNLAQ
jgi:hypothetical protein